MVAESNKPIELTGFSLLFAPEPEPENILFCYVQWS